MCRILLYNSDEQTLPTRRAGWLVSKVFGISTTCFRKSPGKRKIMQNTLSLSARIIQNVVPTKRQPRRCGTRSNPLAQRLMKMNGTAMRKKTTCRQIVMQQKNKWFHKQTAVNPSTKTLSKPVGGTLLVYRLCL